MTPCTLTSLHDLKHLCVDNIIDVRAPSEFARDHLPGAINLPVLTDAQRAQVGTIYVQDSPFNARKIGGALVAHNTADHLQGPLADKQGGWRPLVYCWRGGQRSGAFATILGQVGWRVQLLQGGYQSYRRLIVSTLYDTPLSHRLMLISGGTGTAKTELLHALSARGEQVLDLEGIAQHRGSLFGAIGTAQPAQKLFESRIAAQLSSFDPNHITWIEAESNKVGMRTLPPSLWSAMQSAPRIEITAPIRARAAYLCRTYNDLTEAYSPIADRLEKLQPYHSADLITQWREMAKAGNWQALASGLITAHYDPRYAKSAERGPTAQHHVALSELDNDALSRVADDLCKSFSPA